MSCEPRPPPKATTELRGDPLTLALVRRFVPPGLSPADRRASYGLLEGWVGLVLNAVLFAIKLALGLATGSVALIADAVHTAADSLTSGVLIVGSRIARQPADHEHPFGHGRVELVAALVIAVLLGVAGIEFLEASVRRIITPEPLEAGWWVVGLVVLLALIKEWNSRFALALARESGSVALQADAWHHRSDVFATLLVAVGIAGTKLGVPILDGAMGVGVSLVILWSAYAVAKEAIDPLIGAVPSPEEVAEVASTAMGVPGVEGVHDIVIHRYGDLRLVSLHVETTDKLDALGLHTLSERVQDTVGEGRKGHVVVHADPINRDHPNYPQIEATVTRIVAADERLHSFHDLRVIGEEEHFNVVVDLVVERPGLESSELQAEVADEITGSTGAHAAVVHVEPLFAYDPRPTLDGEG